MGAVGVTMALLAWGARWGAAGLKCYDCEGRNCVADVCEGDYCVVTAFTPMWANTEFRSRKIIKGCVKGSLLKKDIPTACETVPDKEQYITNCFCSSEDFCNKNLQIHPMKALHLVKCSCDGKDCDGPRSGTCLGEYCTILRDGAAKEEIRGCVNTTTSLIERRGDGAVIQPPLTGGVHQEGQKMRNLLETESYMCSKDWCNNEWPGKLRPRKLHCPTFFAVHLQGFPNEDKHGEECPGEYCWNVTIKADGDGLFRGYRAGGCMTLVELKESEIGKVMCSMSGKLSTECLFKDKYIKYSCGPTGFKGNMISEEFNPEGCLEFESEKFSINACFHTEGKSIPSEAKVEAELEKEEMKEKLLETQRPLSPAQAKEEKEIKHDVKQLKAKEGKIRKEKAKMIQPPGGAPGKLAELEDMADRDVMAEEERENNNTIIAVFMTLIVIIVLAGIVWKFDIHRRLFRARYETVAG